MVLFVCLFVILLSKRAKDKGKEILNIRRLENTSCSIKNFGEQNNDDVSYKKFRNRKKN